MEISTTVFSLDKYLKFTNMPEGIKLENFRELPTSKSPKKGIN